MASNKINGDNAAAREYMSKISVNSSQMMDAMDDIVWSIKPDNDTMPRIVARMREYAATVLEPKDIEYAVMNDEKIDNAIRYVQAKDNYGIYPAKSYIVGIIYATTISRIYGEDFYEILNDPELLPGDDFFIPYSEDTETYDAIIAKLEEIPNWIDGGWAPTTVEYCLSECTEEGINAVNESYVR